MSKISCDLDFDQPGEQHGQLTVPWSRNESPWGSLLIPISVIQGRAGPTLMLVGGNHGDEYEGPVTLMNLRRNLRASELRGRVIIIPALNYPAVKAGQRLSPIDGKNMNRVFPGNPDGTITEWIADYVYRFILPLCDVVVDIHAGGKAMQFLPTTVVHQLRDSQRMSATLNAAAAFAAPHCLVLEELDARGMLDTVVEESGKIFISTELGGAGSTTLETLGIARQGVHDLMVHLDMLDTQARSRVTTRFLSTPDHAFCLAQCPGIYEIVKEPGNTVEKGDVLGRIHDIDTPTGEAVDCRATLSGLVIQRHWSGWIERGDCAAVIAIPYGK